MKILAYKIKSETAEFGKLLDVKKLQYQKREYQGFSRFPEDQIIKFQIYWLAWKGDRARYHVFYPARLIV